MKNLRRLFATVVLALTLTIFASAGEISGPGVTIPPPPPPQSSVTGDTQFPGTTSTDDIQALDVAALDPVTEAALSFLQSLLSLF